MDNFDDIRPFSPEEMTAAIEYRRRGVFLYRAR